MWCLQDMVSGGCLSYAGFMVEPNDPKGIFQSKQFHDFKGQDLGRRLEELRNGLSVTFQRPSEYSGALLSEVSAC